MKEKKTVNLTNIKKIRTNLLRILKYDTIYKDSV